MLIPSIDIQDGKAVQLRQGKDFVLACGRHPLELAAEFNRYGELAVIDLDAALGKGENKNLIKEMCKIADLRVGGGIRDRETARDYLRAGAKQLIIGTAASPEFLANFPRESLLVALDQKKGEVYDRGWVNPTGEDFIARASRLSKYCAGFLITFIEAEGGMGGIDLNAVRDLKAKIPGQLTVAGGVKGNDEVIEISKLDIDVQVGMALYTGKIDLAECITGSLKFAENGLVPTVVQDESGQVLMLAYSNRDSLREALERGRGIYYSRSRQELWEKGLSSGCTQELVSCRFDCDRDAVIFQVKQKESACHNGTYSCFGTATAQKNFKLFSLFETLKERKAKPQEGSYSAKLFNDRKYLLEKIAEESSEVLNFTSRDNLRWEIADLIFMLSALAVDEGLSWAEIEAELSGRRK